MQAHSTDLLGRWGRGTVILSPRDLTPEQIPRFSGQTQRAGGQTLLDPQLYDPRADHHRLVGHEYWPNDFDTGILLGGPPLQQLLVDLQRLNEAAGTSRYIIPGVYGDRVDADWLAVQESIASEAAALYNDRPRLATVCLSAEALRFEDQVEEVLSASESWDVHGYYVVPEHPGGQYLVDDPLWLTNLLLLCSGLKLQGRSVIVGYSNHQMLALAAANVDAIASGTWLNVRSFPKDKFLQADEESTSRRAKWYYSPQSLSEYKITFLDMAHLAGVLPSMAPSPALACDYANVLFTGAQPSSTAYGEQGGFRHYLHCLQGQCSQARRATFRETVAGLQRVLDEAEQMIAFLHRHGVRGQDRDFKDIVDVNRAALSALEATRGFVLDRRW